MPRALVLEIVDHAGARRLFAELSRAHRSCFPEDALESDDATADAFFDRVTWLHEETQATWFLLRVADSEGVLGEIVGFACGYAYSDSWYGAHLGVVPSHRRRGLGSYLMRVVQSRAARAGVLRIQASVDIDPKVGRGRLLQYYERHGASVVRTGMGSAGSVSGSVIRIERVFTPAIAAEELEESERHVFVGNTRRNFHVSVALGLGAVWVLIQNVRRR